MSQETGRDVVTLGMRIEELRLDMDISLNELARRADISSGHLSNLERDAHLAPNIWTISRVARELYVSLDTLLEGVEPP